MKKKFRFFMAAFAAVGLMASCSSEEVTPVDPDNTGKPGIEEGEGTYATFYLDQVKTKATTFDPPTSGSTSENDNNDGDLAYTDVRLLIFDSQTKALEINELFGTDARKTVLVQVGNKKIFAVANAQGDLKSHYHDVLETWGPTSGKTLDDFYALFYNAGTPQALGTTTNRSFDIEPLHKHARTTVGLPASNTNAIEYELKANIEREDAHNDPNPSTGGTSDNNAFKIELVYMIAKARLHLGQPITSIVSGGDKVSNITYTIRNLARVTNFVQNVVAGVPRSYYYTKYDLGTTAAEFLLDFDLASKMQTTAITETPGDYLYVPENNNQLLRRGQSSHFVIKAKFEPGKVVTDAKYYTSGIVETVKTLAEIGGNMDYVYTLTEDIPGIPAGKYFTSLAILQKTAWLYAKNAEWTGSPTQLAEAEAIVNTANEKATGSDDPLYYQFYNAQSWYRLDIGESTTGANLRPGVLRGNAYNAKINTITGPGVPDEGEVEIDPEQPVVSMTYISAVIEVKKWDLKYQSGDLK